MDFQKRIEELEARHERQVLVYIEAKQKVKETRVELIRLEGAIDTLRELQSEEK